MNAFVTPAPEAAPTSHQRAKITPSSKQVIELITVDYREQPSLEVIASQLGQSPTQLQKVFTRWAGLSPKAFFRP